MDVAAIDVIVTGGPPGPEGPQGPPGAVTATINAAWNWLGGAQSGSVANGRVGLDTDDPEQAAWIHISAVADGNKNYGAMIRLMRAGSRVYVWDPGNSARWGKWAVAATPEDNGTWFRISVDPLSWQGGEPQGNNADVEIALVFGG